MKHFTHSEENIFGCCVTPCRSKNVLLTTFGQKTQFAKPGKKNLEPLDLLATVGQPCVCVNVSVLVSVCVCGVEQRCGVVTLKSPKKTHFFSFKKKLSLSLTIIIKTTKQNSSFTFIL